MGQTFFVVYCSFAFSIFFLYYRTFQKQHLTKGMCCTMRTGHIWSCDTWTNFSDLWPSDPIYSSMEVEYLTNTICVCTRIGMEIPGSTRVFEPTSNLYRKNIWILLVFVMHVDMIFQLGFYWHEQKQWSNRCVHGPWSNHAWKAKTLRIYVRYDIDKPNLLWLILAARPYGWTNDCCIVLFEAGKGSPSWRERVNLHKV